MTIPNHPNQYRTPYNFVMNFIWPMKEKETWSATSAIANWSWWSEEGTSNDRAIRPVKRDHWLCKNEGCIFYAVPQRTKTRGPPSPPRKQTRSGRQVKLPGIYDDFELDSSPRSGKKRDVRLENHGQESPSVIVWGRKKRREKEGDSKRGQRWCWRTRRRVDDGLT
jgi:hypothetical protein